MNSLPYFGKASYVFQRMPMGLSAKQLLAILYECYSQQHTDRAKYLAIIDDL